MNLYCDNNNKKGSAQGGAHGAYAGFTPYSTTCTSSDHINQNTRKVSNESSYICAYKVPTTLGGGAEVRQYSKETEYYVPLLFRKEGG